jgi:hypothetical protein
MKYLIPPLLISALFVSGCVTARFIPKYSDYKIQAGNLSQTEILVTEEDIQKPYNEIGTITLEIASANQALVFGKIRKKAKKVGADAVIKVKLEKAPVMAETKIERSAYGGVVYNVIENTQISENYVYSGLAVKYK